MSSKHCRDVQTRCGGGTARLPPPSPSFSSILGDADRRRQDHELSDTGSSGEPARLLPWPASLPRRHRARCSQRRRADPACTGGKRTPRWRGPHRRPDDAHPGSRIQGWSAPRLPRGIPPLVRLCPILARVPQGMATRSRRGPTAPHAPHLQAKAAPRESPRLCTRLGLGPETQAAAASWCCAQTSADQITATASGRACSISRAAKLGQDPICILISMMSFITYQHGLDQLSARLPSMSAFTGGDVSEREVGS